MCSIHSASPVAIGRRLPVFSLLGRVMAADASRPMLLGNSYPPSRKKGVNADPFLEKRGIRVVGRSVQKYALRD